MPGRPVLFYDCVYSDGLSPEARFPGQRYRLVREELTRRGLERTARFIDSPLCSVDDLLTVHAPDYVDAFIEGRLDERMVRRIGLRPWTDRIRERTLKILGATVAATHTLFTEPVDFAGNLAGGTHHAFRDRGAGYCVFNDIAVAARVAQRDHGITRILIVDLDVHQGDGTAAIFDGDPTVFTFSLHCAENFPLRKETSDLDVALPSGSTDETYLAALADVLPGLFDDHRPELVIFQAGVDPLKADHLGRLELSRAGLHRRNKMVYALVGQYRIPTLILMGGGYARPIERTVEALADVFEQAVEASAPGQAS